MVFNIEFGIVLFVPWSCYVRPFSVSDVRTEVCSVWFNCKRNVDGNDEYTHVTVTITNSLAYTICLCLNPLWIRLSGIKSLDISMLVWSVIYFIGSYSLSIVVRQGMHAYRGLHCQCSWCCSFWILCDFIKLRFCTKDISFINMRKCDMLANKQLSIKV